MFKFTSDLSLKRKVDAKIISKSYCMRIQLRKLYVELCMERGTRKREKEILTLPFVTNIKDNDHLRKRSDHKSGIGIE